MDYLMKPSLMWIQSSGSHECLQLPGSLPCWNIWVKLLLEEDAENVVKNLNNPGLISRRPTYNCPAYLISEKPATSSLKWESSQKWLLQFNASGTPRELLRDMCGCQLKKPRSRSPSLELH